MTVAYATWPFMKRASFCAYVLFTAVVSTPLLAQTYDFGALDRFLIRTANQIRSGFEVLIVQEGREIYWKQFGPWPRG